MNDDGTLSSTPASMPAWAEAFVTDEEGNPTSTKVVSQDAEGNYIIDWQAWGRGYLNRVFLDYAKFNGWVNENTGAYVEFHGKNTNRGTFQLDAKFKTKQAIEEWTRSWTSSVALHAVLPPVRPNSAIGAYGHEANASVPGTPDVATKHVNQQTLYDDPANSQSERDNFKNNYYRQYPVVSGEIKTDRPIAYREERNSGYRAIVTNKSAYPMYMGAKLTIGNLVPRWDSFGKAMDETLSYHATDLTLSEGLLSHAQVDYITVRHIPANSKVASGSGSGALNGQYVAPNGYNNQIVVGGNIGLVAVTGAAVATLDWDTTLKKYWDANGDGAWDGGNVTIPATEWLNNDAYYFEVHFKRIDANVTEADKAWADVFGYAIDSANVSLATDPAHAESEDAWPDMNQYDIAHYGTDHAWGCWGGAPNTDTHYAGYKAYVGNYYVCIQADSRLKATYPNKDWDLAGKPGKPSPDGELTYSDDQANLYAIAGMPNMALSAKAYFDAGKTADEAMNDLAPLNLDRKSTRLNSSHMA